MRAARERAGFENEASAAKAIGCSRTLVIAWEKDASDIRKSSYAYSAAIAYKVRPEWIRDPSAADGFPWSPGGDARPIIARAQAQDDPDPVEDMAVAQGCIVAVLAAIPSVGQALLAKLDDEPDSPYLVVLKSRLRHELASRDVDALRAAARKIPVSKSRKHR